MDDQEKALVEGSGAPVKQRLVTNMEVLAYAGSGCRSCWGKGYVFVWKGDNTRHERLCGCAVRSFKQANEGKVEITSEKRLAWRAL